MILLFTLMILAVIVAAIILKRQTERQKLIRNYEHYLKIEAIKRAFGEE